MDAECSYEGDCIGTCPKCDAQVRYLDAELNRKMERGEAVTISGISVDAFEEILKSRVPFKNVDPENQENDEALLDGIRGEYDELDDRIDDHDSFMNYKMGECRPK